MKIALNAYRKNVYDIEIDIRVYNILNKLLKRIFKTTIYNFY
jgi:hypothetical protein